MLTASTIPAKRRVRLVDNHGAIIGELEVVPKLNSTYTSQEIVEFIRFAVNARATAECNSWLN